MKIHYKIIVIIISIALSQCKPEDYYYKDLVVQKDVIYPGKVDSLKFSGGENRFLLSMILPNDPKVNKLVIFWNNYRDSLEYTIPSEEYGTTKKIIVNDIPESAYTFNVYTYNIYNTRSIKTEVSGRVYGEFYKLSLTNRALTSSTYNTTTRNASLVFVSETATNFTGTRVTYTDNNDIKKTVLYAKTANTLSVTNYKRGTEIMYEAGYMPIETALDTLYSEPKSLVIN